MLKKNKFKIISIITTLFVITTLISFKDLKVKATVSDKPDFDIKFSVSETAVLGEDIVVKGQIIPKPFEIPVPEKEVVFVVDVDPLNNGKLSSLISKIKTFISKITNNENIKIAIIAYDKDAEIKRANNIALLDSEKASEIINKLNKEKNTKTNTGEALRKALYLLNSEESKVDANKTIILISDSIPTASTLYSKGSGLEGNFYTNINKENYENATTDNVSDYNRDLEYAKIMGELINKKGYNVFTIGYGLDKNNEGYQPLREIHQAMSGNDMTNNDNDEKNGFFIAGDNKDIVEKMFSDIADKVLQNYSLNNIDMNINFTGDFSLNIEGNTVNLSNINYKLVYTSNGKAEYEADPIPFEFTIKANTVGYQQIFDKVTITYPWKDSIEKIDIAKDLFITVQSNDLPNITAKLISDKIVSIEENEEFTLKYEINPESFSFNNENSSVKSEVVFVIDVSKDMSSYMNPLMNDLWNDILNNDKLKEAKTEYNIITFSNNVQKSTDLNSSKYSNYDDYISDLNNNCIKEFLKADNSNAKNIEKTYKKIVELLDKGKPEAKKNIVFISETSNISYGHEKDYGVLKDKGYNIITVEIENLENSNNKNDLRDFHKALNGNFDNYFYCIDQNELQNNILAEAAKSIISNAGYNYYIFNPVLQIDLGKSFEGVSGIDTIDNNIIKIKIPEIKYKYSETNNKYNADKFTIEFTLKPKSGEIDELNFGIDNKLVYKKLIKNEEKYSLIETPTVIVKQNINNLTHGLYNGINNGQVIIQENSYGEVFEIAKGSTATFGANFTFSGMSTNFELNIDNNLSVEDGAIKVYRLINNELKEVERTTIRNEGNNRYDISIVFSKEDESVNKNILILYRGTVGELEKSDMKNTITINSISKDVNMSTKSSSNINSTLPDLF